MKNKKEEKWEEGSSQTRVLAFPTHIGENESMSPSMMTCIPAIWQGEENPLIEVLKNS